MITRFRIPDGIFADLADGPSSPDTIALLHRAQLTKNLLLLRFLLDSEVPDARVRHAFEVIAAAHDRAGEPVARLLSAPATGAWVSRCVLALRARRLAHHEMGRLAALAVVAAARAGIDAELSVDVVEGAVVLPGVGSLVVGGDASSTVDFRVRDGVTTVGGPHGELAILGPGQRPPRGWSAAHWLNAECDGLRLSVLLDDLDPFRDCYRKPLASRLDDATVLRWEALLDQAWAILVRQDRARAAEVAGGLTALVPLSQTDAEPGLSATSRIALGALALTLPPRPEHLAATLVHEFQHSKLSALLDLLPLYDPRATERYFAPWRKDPRPIGGLLQGAYAFLAVTDLWRRLASTSCGPVDAMAHFTELREQVRHVLATLETSPHLTGDGRQFVARLQGVMNKLLTHPAPADKVALAQAELTSKLDNWAMSHSTL